MESWVRKAAKGIEQAVMSVVTRLRVLQLVKWVTALLKWEILWLPMFKVGVPIPRGVEW